MPETIALNALPETLAASGAVRMRSRLSSISGGKVLDVATGSGDFIETLMKTLRDYDCFVGIDIARKDLASAETRFKDQPVRMLEMNAESLEFDDDSFDTVGMAYSLHHLRRADAVLREMRRVLKPGGTLIITEEISDGRQTEAQKTSILQHAWQAQIDSLFGETHRTTWARHRIEELISRLQLESVEIFESTHPVECLFCERRFECDDPKSVENVSRALKDIDDGLKRLKAIANPEARRRLQETGKELRNRNMKFGNAHPLVLLAVGRKPRSE
jgi:ubiquinone/menaquinone biosynthesis C-methylase UbiE